MDDSMEAFELPSLSRKKLFSSRKKCTISPLASENSPQMNNATSSQNGLKYTKMVAQNNLVLPATSGNDTLADIPDLTDEGTALEINGDRNRELNSQNISSKLPTPNGGSSKIQETLPLGGYCKICSQQVPEDECKTHYISCMKDNFASKQDLKSRTVSTSTGNDYKNEIDKENVKEHCTGQNLGQEKIPCGDDSAGKNITSSYFMNAGSKSLARNKEPCPSCNMNLTGLTISSKQSHINRCLDNQIESNKSMENPDQSNPRIKLNQLKIKISTSSSNTASDSNKCSKCGKTLKSKGGFNRHVKSCTGAKAAKKKGEARKRNPKTPRNAEEEILQVAKALSKSEAEEKKREKKQQKLRKKEIAVPVMLQESPASRKAALEARLVDLIGKSDDPTTSTDDGEVPCTPAIPLPSKWNKPPVSNFDLPSCSTDDTSQYFKPQVVGGEPYAEAPRSVISEAENPCNSQFTLEVSSADSSEEPALPPVMASKFAFGQQSKWHLSNGASSQMNNYRVSGLLTQFQGPAKDLKLEGVPTIDHSPVEAISNKINLEDGDNMSSTLQQLIDLGRSPSHVSDDNDPCLTIDLTQDDVDVEQCMVNETPPINGVATDEQPPEAENSVIEEELLFPGGKSPVSHLTAEAEDMNCLLSLRSDFSKLLNCNSYSDLALRFDNDPTEDIPIHKCVLFCRMPTLLQTFEKNANDGIFHVANIHKEEMLCLLDYIYTGSLKNITKDDVSELVNRLTKTFQTENRNSPEKSQPVATDHASPSFVPSDDDLFPCAPSPCLDFIVGNSPTVRLTDFRSRLENSIEIRLDDDRTERIYVRDGDVSEKRDVNKIVESDEAPGVSGMRERRFSANKRRSVHFTPLPGNKQKFRRMTGSTPKSPLTGGRPRASVAGLDTPVDIHDFSSIASHSPHPNLFNSPALKLRRCSETPRHSGRDDVTGGVMQSQPTACVAGEDDVFVTSHSQPLPDDFHFDVDGGSNPERTFDFSVNDSVLLLAAVGQSRFPALEAGPAVCKTPVAHSKTRRSVGAVPFTPMPNYSDMDTPDVVRQGQKMGLKRTLGKKKMKVKLKELYRYRHQVVTSDEEEPQGGDVVAERTTPCGKSPDNDDIGIVEVVDSDTNCARKTASPNGIQVMKAEKDSRRAIKALESLSTEDFAELFKRALSGMHKKGTLLKALRLARDATSGIARGSRDDVQRWLNSVTPSSPHYSPEFTVLASLSSDKQQAIVEALSSFAVNESAISPYHQHMFDILPTVYRVMTRIKPDLLASK